MTNYANRGMSLENLISQANTEYEKDGIGLIQKIETPVTVVRGGFDGSRQVTNAFFKKKSTVDFRGTLANGRSIAFEAKQTMNKHTFRFDVVKPHQLDFLQKHAALGGFSFVIVEFTETKEIHRIMIPEQWDELQKKAAEGKQFKSCPLSEIRKIGYQCQAAGKNPLHYLQDLV